MAQGHVAAIAGNGWEVGAVTAPKTGDPSLANKLSTFPFPGTAAGKYTPSFLGGSDLAVPAKAANAGLGAEWIKYLHRHDQPDRSWRSSRSRTRPRC